MSLGLGFCLEFGMVRNEYMVEFSLELGFYRAAIGRDQKCCRLSQQP